MKTLPKFFKQAALAIVAVALLTACKSMPLEEQILEGMNEAGTYTFKHVGPTVVSGAREQFIRIHDKPGKVGFEVFEYGQKHPCNQGFQKAIKTTASGLVAYEQDANARSIACNEKLRYIFRTDAGGRPYEGWFDARKVNDKRQFVDLTRTEKFYEEKAILPKYQLVK